MNDLKITGWPKVERDCGERGVVEREVAKKAGGSRRHWSAEGPKENWFTKGNQTASIIHKGGRNNNIPGIALRMNKL